MLRLVRGMEGGKRVKDRNTPLVKLTPDFSKETCPAKLRALYPLYAILGKTVVWVQPTGSCGCYFLSVAVMLGVSRQCTLFDARPSNDFLPGPSWVVPTFHT